MAVRLENLQVPAAGLLEAVGRASGLPMGVVRTTAPAELLFANGDLEEILHALGLQDANARARWIASPEHPLDGWEIGLTPLGGADGLAVVAVRVGPGPRLDQVLDRLGRRYGLSTSEQREVRHMARGLPIKESAKELGISPETVRVRRKRVYKKMALKGHEALLARVCEELMASQVRDNPRAA